MPTFEDVLAAYDRAQWDHRLDPKDFRLAVIAAKDAEVRAERERCHKIAVDYMSVYMGENTYGDGRKCGEQIAAAIRAGGNRG